MKYTRKVIKKICAHEARINLALTDAPSNESLRLVEDLGADDLDTLQLIMSIEEELVTSVPEDQSEKIVTFGQLVDTFYELKKDDDMTCFHDHLERD